MTIAIGVVAHRSRIEAARKLVRDVDADHYSVDEGNLGCRANHMQVWRWHAAHPADWHVVLEDDAKPVPEFRAQLDAALDVVPTAVASLYLGGGYTDDRMVRMAIERADRVGAHWLLTHGRVLSAVAIAVRGDMVPMLLKGLNCRSAHAIDKSLGLWARGNGQQVAYAVPSLVDHADEQSLATPFRRRGPRRALSVGTHERWSNKTIFMV